MKKTHFLLLINLLYFNNSYSQYYPLREIEEKVIYSKILDENRSILISKPNGYDHSDEKYFVVYVLDGNINTHFTSGIAELLYQSGYPKLLVVGIPNTHRSRDLTPTSVEDTPLGGGAYFFMEFIEKELLPYVNMNYRAHNYAVLVGHSFGGLFALNTLFNNPDLFDGYVAITPTVVYDSFLVGNELRDFFNRTKELNKSVFFSVGHEPGAEGKAVFQLNKEVFEKYAPEKLDWKFEYYPKENHSTTPLIATLDGLRFIFKDLVPSDSLVVEKGFTKMLDYYESLQTKYDKQIKIPQRILMNYGYTLLDSKDIDETFKVFNYYKDNYPHIPVGYDGLAILYERINENEKAVENLRKLLEIDPNYEDAMIRLKKLEKIKD